VVVERLDMEGAVLDMKGAVVWFLVSSWIVLLALVAGFAAILGAFVLLARHVRRSGVGGGIMGPIDEIYQPTAYRFRQEIQVQEERMVPMPSPADPLRRRGNAGDQRM
jgi:hypothetical protein